MSAIIIVSEQHHGIPVVYNLGETTLIVTSDYGTPDAFELVAPVIDEATQEVTHNPTTVILDDSETYNLYQCLHELFHPTREARSA